MKPSKPLLQSFAPVIHEQAQTLVLGSMPGQASLDAGQYYAHPRNLFWRFPAEVLGVEVPTDYRQRLQLLAHFRVALWDVLQHCERAGSLDSHIVAASEHANDLRSLLTRYPSIDTLCFNGQKAFQAFKRHLMHLDQAFYQNYTLHILPSTSPANAAIPIATKRSQWQAKVWQLGEDGTGNLITA